MMEVVNRIVNTREVVFMVRVAAKATVVMVEERGDLPMVVEAVLEVVTGILAIKTIKFWAHE